MSYNSYKVDGRSGDYYNRYSSILKEGFNSLDLLKPVKVLTPRYSYNWNIIKGLKISLTD